MFQSLLDYPEFIENRMDKNTNPGFIILYTCRSHTVMSQEFIPSDLDDIHHVQGKTTSPKRDPKVPSIKNNKKGCTPDQKFIFNLRALYNNLSTYMYT